MVVYFSKQSLSHYKIDRRQIIVCLKNGENLIVDASERFIEYVAILDKMLKEYESYSDIVRYDVDTKKLYF